MKEHQSEFKNSLIPLYLGITGHRDLRDEDKDKLIEMIKEFIRSKQAECPHTPVVMLSPLAEGADRIAAQASIECGIDFIAVLPMPEKVYRRSFVSKESNLEFDYYLGKASRRINLPLPAGTTCEDVFNDPERRHEQYYQAGMFIIKYCHTLIALWDGVDTGKKGGTASVVRLKRSGVPGKLGKTREKLQYLQSGPVYHIVTPRKSHPIPDMPFENRVYHSCYIIDDMASALRRDGEILAHIDSLNKDILNQGTLLKERARISSEKLFNHYPELLQVHSLASIARKRGIIRELAVIFQSRRIFALRILLILVVLAFIFLQIYTILYKPIYLFLYPLIMGIGAFWFYLAKRNRFENKHEDYRALAEAFRVQFYLTATGSKDNVSDHYLKRHRGELEWVLYTLRSSELELWADDTFTEAIFKNEPIKVCKFLETEWVDEQLKYFNRSAHRNNRLNSKWETLANWFFFGAITLACILLTGTAFIRIFHDSSNHLGEVMNYVLSGLTQVFLVLAAVFSGYSEKMVFGEQTKSYHQMAQLFNIAKIKLSAAIEANDIKEAEEIVWELAYEALVENGDWLLLHRSRPLEIPKG